MSSSIPLPDSDLTTQRLILRLWSPAEIDAALDGVRMPRWAPDFPTEGDRVIAGVVAHQAATPANSGHRLIVERETGVVVGSTSLLWPPAEGPVELGYGVVASRRGRGYATEAARAMVGLALDSPGIHEVVAEVELANPASARVLEKSGLRRRFEDATTARYGTSTDNREVDPAAK